VQYSLLLHRGQENGTARPEVLQELLSTTQRVVQEVDSVEYGLTDIQEYYANTGALKRAAETAQGGTFVNMCKSLAMCPATGIRCMGCAIDGKHLWVMR
jgi:cobalamin biosynthesis Mg chelatase CobN